MSAVDHSAVGDSLHQEDLPGFILIRTDEVDEGERLRPVDPVWAGALGQAMLRDGQDVPIQVCRLPGRNSWTLVAGAHRLAGAVFHGIEHLKAEVTSSQRDERRLREVRENLFRKDLMPLDRAAFFLEAVSIYKRKAGIDPERAGRSISAEIRWKKAVKEEAVDANATIAFAYGWSKTIGDEIGFSARTIEEDLRLYRRLPASTIERLRAARHPILKVAKQLKALADLEPAEGNRVVDKLVGEAVNGKTIQTVAQARGLLDQRSQIDPEAKRLSAFIGAFNRMGVAEKKGALSQLAGMLPAGFAIVEGEQPPAQNASALTPYEAERIFVGVRDAVFYHGLTKPGQGGPAMDNWRDAGDRLHIAEAIAKRFAIAAGEAK